MKESVESWNRTVQFTDQDLHWEEKKYALYSFDVLFPTDMCFVMFIRTAKQQCYKY